jgi:type II secretory pathway component HofQ
MRPSVIVIALALAACHRAPKTSTTARAPSPGPAADATAGEPATIDVDVRDAPIEDVLRLIARAARINLDVDPDVTGTVSLDVHAAPWPDVLATVARDHALRVEQVGPVWRVMRASAPPAAPVAYTGAPIEVRFDDTPLRESAATLARLSGRAIVVDPAVADDILVTLHLRNAPWDLALDHLARKYGLRVVDDGARLRLARP